eukprot:6002852-Prymnesium_polylepis.5
MPARHTAHTAARDDRPYNSHCLRRPGPPRLHTASSPRAIYSGTPCWWQQCTWNWQQTRFLQRYTSNNASSPELN